MNAIAAAKMAVKTGAAFGAEFVRLIRSGELDRRFIWYGVEGASRYVKMIAAGDLAPDAKIDERRAVCATCPSRTWDEKQQAAYCGPKLRGTLKGDKPTCGCPIGAKTSCASQACPQKKWPTVPLTITATQERRP